MNADRLFDSSSLPVLEAAAVIADMDHDAEGYAEVATVYLEELAPTLQALARADSLPLLLPILHEAANSMSIVGARRGAHLVRRLETDIHEGARPDIAGAVALCGLCLQRSADALQAFLDARR